MQGRHRRRSAQLSQAPSACLLPHHCCCLHRHGYWCDQGIARIVGCSTECTALEPMSAGLRHNNTCWAGLPISSELDAEPRLQLVCKRQHCAAEPPAPPCTFRVCAAASLLPALRPGPPTDPGQPPAPPRQQQAAQPAAMAAPDSRAAASAAASSSSSGLEGGGSQAGTSGRGMLGGVPLLQLRGAHPAPSTQTLALTIAAAAVAGAVVWHFSREAYYSYVPPKVRWGWWWVEGREGAGLQGMPATDPAELARCGGTGHKWRLGASTRDARHLQAACAVCARPRSPVRRQMRAACCGGAGGRRARAPPSPVCLQPTGHALRCRPCALSCSAPLPCRPPARSTSTAPAC